MSKEVENKICEFCESEYKLIYEPTSTSGYAKHCPFCGEIYTPEDEKDITEYEE